MVIRAYVDRADHAERERNHVEGVRPDRPERQSVYEELDAGGSLTIE